MQTVVGPRMEFLDIVPEWPGSAHDSRIFRTSLLYIRYYIYVYRKSVRWYTCW